MSLSRLSCEISRLRQGNCTRQQANYSRTDNHFDRLIRFFERLFAGLLLLVFRLVFRRLWDFGTAFFTTVGADFSSPISATLFGAATVSTFSAMFSNCHALGAPVANRMKRNAMTCCASQIINAVSLAILNQWFIRLSSSWHSRAGKQGDVNRRGAHQTCPTDLFKKSSAMM